MCNRVVIGGRQGSAHPGFRRRHAGGRATVAWAWTTSTGRRRCQWQSIVPMSRCCGSIAAAAAGDAAPVNSRFGPLSGHPCGSMNPQHLKLLSDWSDLYRHLITLAFTQHGSAQRGFAADDLNELSAADQFHAAPLRAQKELLLPAVGIDQTDQRAELDTFAGVVGARAEVAPMGHSLPDDLASNPESGSLFIRSKSQIIRSSTVVVAAARRAGRQALAMCIQLSLRRGSR